MGNFHSKGQNGQETSKCGKAWIFVLHTCDRRNHFAIISLQELRKPMISTVNYFCDIKDRIKHGQQHTHFSRNLQLYITDYGDMYFILVPEVRGQPLFLS